MMVGLMTPIQISNADLLKVMAAAAGTVLIDGQFVVFGELPFIVVLQLIWALFVRFLIILSMINMIIFLAVFADQFSKGETDVFTSTPILAFAVFCLFYFTETAAIFLSLGYIIQYASKKLGKMMS
jgi:hypothetical protein